MSYTVTGYINRRNKTIKKEFSTLVKANRFIDSVLDKYDCQVEESETSGLKTKYICDDYTRIYLEENI